MKRFRLGMRATALIACGLTTANASAQNKNVLTARELFYTPPPTAASSKPAVQAAETQPTLQPATSANSASVANPAKLPKKTVAKASKEANTPATSSSQTAVANADPKSSSPNPGTSVSAGRPVNEAPALRVPLGVRYSVLKRDEAGKFQEVDADTTFHSGDRIRLQVESNTSGYLYVVTQGSSGNWQVLAPTSDVAGGSNRVQRGETRQIPSGDRGQFVFDEQAGAEKLFLVLSRQPEANLDKLIYAIGAPPTPAKPDTPHMMVAQASVSDDVISRIRSQMSSRDLVFEKVDSENTAQQTRPTPTRAAMKTENASYVVNPSTAPDARLIVDLKLKHQ